MIQVDFRGVVTNVVDYDIKVSSNSSHAITFTFGLIPLRKLGTFLVPPSSSGLNRTTTVFLNGFVVYHKEKRQYLFYLKGTKSLRERERERERVTKRRKQDCYHLHHVERRHVFRAFLFLLLGWGIS